MKKLFYVALMGLGLSSVFAQQADRKVEYGLKVGYTSSRWNFDIPQKVKDGGFKLKNNGGYSFGGFVEIPVSEKFSF
ncbi:hypothetical protein EDL99_08845 [Ornithobacterium rhinotracheale]|uniref:hypothetical protein n=1 Tax=Ornithobacterium rhinotracheale TaxID=28251 RepID=UPI00129C23AB|nr:hypothetical protein [Ornithobacterium rhinotracheale]MRJ08965.1 hypothetical protein [Ornithobacterium rhinotracheale]UOH78863.1 PorT family protein [Ornithobacterium rhinotracheale]